MRKKILLISLLISSFGGGFAQQPNKKPAESNITKKGIENIELINKLTHQRVLQQDRALFQQMDSIIYQEYDGGSSSYKDVGRYLYEYNTAGKMFLSTEYYFDYISTNSWIPDFKEEILYDQNNNPTGWLSYSYDTGLGQFVISDSGYIEYDVNNNVTQRTGYTWNSGTSQWDNDWRETTTYNANQNMTESVELYWDSGTSQWVNSYKVDYVYNGSQQLTERISSSWDTGTSSWAPSYMESLTYNTSGLVEEEVDSYYTGSVWELSSKSIYQYNMDDQITVRTDQQYDSGTSSWENYNLKENTYDGNGDWVLSEKSFWNDNTSSWVYDYKDDFSHNTNYAFNELIIPLYFDEPERLFTHRLDTYEYFEYDTANAVWVETSFQTFYYSEVDIASNKEIASLDASVYPNPAQSTVNFVVDGQDSKALIVYDARGKVVYNKEITSKESINVSSWNSGVYIYQIKAGENIQQGKLIIE